MAAGENIREIASLLVGSGYTAHGILKISDNVCCFGRCDNPSTYYTVRFEPDGTLPTLIDSITEQNSGNNEHAPMIHIHDNIYAYYFNSTTNTFQTVEILPDGNIVGRVDSIDIPFLQLVNGDLMGTVHMHDDIYVFMHYGRNGGTYIRSIGISSDGTLTDIGSRVSAGARYPVKPMRISDNVIACLGREGFTGYIKTYNVDDNGIINGIPIDTEVYSTGTTYASIIHIKGNVYAMACEYMSTNWLITVNIEPNGNITHIIDQFTPSNDTQFHDVCHVGGNAYALTTRHNSHFGVTTVDISNNGMINNVIDGPFGSISGLGVKSYITHMHDDIYAAIDRNGGGGSRFFTLGIDTPSGTPSRHQLFTGGLSHRAMR